MLIDTKSYLLLTAYKRSGTKDDLDKVRFYFLLLAQALEQRMLYISTLIDKSLLALIDISLP